MFEDIGYFLMRAFAIPIEYFGIILEATETVSYLITAFIIVCLVRFILKPIFGGRAFGASDRAKFKREEVDND